VRWIVYSLIEPSVVCRRKKKKREERGGFGLGSVSGRDGGTNPSLRAEALIINVGGPSLIDSTSHTNGRAHTSMQFTG
jgi:hypothetical protein